MRRLAAILLAFTSASVILLQGTAPPPNVDQRIRKIDLMPALRRDGVPLQLGPFQIAGLWYLESAHNAFGNYSGLALLHSGILVAVGDKNGILYFTPPDRPGPWKTRMDRPNKGDPHKRRVDLDAESISIDPVTQTMLVGYEGIPRMTLFSPDLSAKRVIEAPVLLGWPQNQGPEAMRRLADGRTVMIGEVYAHTLDRRRHPGFIYPGMPRDYETPARFEVEMPEGFRPTELAQLPDGRLLVLGRTFTLAGFRSTISLLDPRAIRPGAVVMTHEIARMDDPRVAENYEGMVVQAEPDGAIAVWLISDNNLMTLLQRTLVLKLRVRPEAL